jgi:hypothetical protein
MNKEFLQGFMKQAEAYGFNTLESLELLKVAERPYRNEQAAKVRALDESINANKYTRQQDPVQYAINPFVEGPVSEIKNRLTRRYHAAAQQHPIATHALMAGGAVGPGIFMAGADRMVHRGGGSLIPTIGALLAAGGVAGPYLLGNPRAQEKARKYKSKTKDERKQSKQ